MMTRLNEIFKDLSIPDTVTVALDPKPHQLEDVYKSVEWHRSANYSEVGTGKSLVSYLWIMNKLYQGKKVVVVMPPALIGQYARNFNVIEGHHFTIKTLLKDRIKRHKEMDEWDKAGWPDVVIMGYQLFTKYRKSLYAYKAIVCDEAHAIANPATQAFQAVYQVLFMRNMDLLLMTATPCTTELRSAYGHIRLKTPEVYNSLDHFDRLHTVWQIGAPHKTAAGYKDVPVIEGHLNRFSVRRRQADVLSLADPTLIEHWVDLDYKHAEVYQTLLEQRILELGDEIIVAKNQQALRQMALQLITNIESYSDVLLDDNPLDNLKEIVEAVGPEKIAVFCHFRGTVKKLQKEFHKLNPAVVYGDSDVQANVDKFLKDPTCRIIFLNYQSGGAGFNLQEDCHYVVFFEPSGSPGMLVQALGRVQRNGQTKPVVAWVFRYSATISSKLLSKAFSRAEDIKTVMNDDTSFVDYLSRL
jgi:SNF2 family DNA or RNA helicase